MCRVHVPKHHGLVVVASVVGCTASVFDASWSDVWFSKDTDDTRTQRYSCMN